MEHQRIFDLLKEGFKDSVISITSDNCHPPFIKVVPQALPDVLKFLRDGEDLHFDSLSCLCGLDYPADEKEGGPGRMEVAYHLLSTRHKHGIALKTEIPRLSPDLPSAVPIYPSADWFEREAFEMYGIRFTGHPDLRNLLLPDDWEGNPLRKDYTFPEFYHGIKV